MSRKEGLSNTMTFTEYIGDFESDPGKQVQTRVFCKHRIIHVCYFINEGTSIGDPRISDRWLGEIFDYLKSNGYRCEDVCLHNNPQGLEKIRPFEPDWV